MQVIAKSRLVAFWTDHPRAEQGLREWFAIADKTVWATPDDAKQHFGKGIDFVGDNRIIFDIRNNEFRLIVHVSYKFKRALIKFVGTHKDYDRIDPETVS